MLNKKTITVFEHQTLKLGQDIDIDILKALQKYYGNGDKPYFSLVHNGVRFNEYVGVIQIGDILIEVLPKADKDGGNDKTVWRNVLIQMMSAVDLFDIHAPTTSQLKIKPNSILDLYFALFIKEVEYLLHTGLIKQYRKKESNVTSLKGNLLFSKHIQQNLIHQERFYVSHNTYDVEHKLHFILFKTIKLLNKINTNIELKSKIGSLLLYFPEMPDVNASEALFNKLSFNRKTLPYEKAISIAKMILLHYHPDVSSGRNNVLALMFDMNVLWEKFVYCSLKKNRTNESITEQFSKKFWKPEKGYSSQIRPDIVIQSKDYCVVLDTKWKNLNGYNPSPADLKQMYVYHHYYGAKRVALVYPGKSIKPMVGRYFDPLDEENSKHSDNQCSIVTLSINNELSIGQWQKEIYEHIKKYIYPATENHIH